MMQESNSPSPLSSPRHYNNNANYNFNMQGSDPSALGFQGALPNINSGTLSPKTMYDPPPQHSKLLQDTPVNHHKLNRQYPNQNYAMRQYINGFNG